jgi:hypothetical protein
MDKYRKGLEQRLKPKMNHDTMEYKVEPFRDAQVALGQAQFVQREREQFFNEAYSEILADLFVAWLKSEPHCNKEREYLYSVAMALGSVKEKLVGIETYGNNVKYIQQLAKGSPAERGEDDNNE